MASEEPKSYDSSHNYQLDSLKKSKYSNILSNSLSTNEITNDVTNTTDNEVLDQENQDYYNWSNQQFIAHKHNNSWEQVTWESVTEINLEEEDGFHKWADNYDQSDSTRSKTGSSHTFNDYNHGFNLTKTKHSGKSKTRIVSEVSESSNKPDFSIGKHQS